VTSSVPVAIFPASDGRNRVSPYARCSIHAVETISTSRLMTRIVRKIGMRFVIAMLWNRFG